MPDATPVLSVVTLVNDEELYRASRASLDRQHDRGAVQWLPIDADGHGWNAATALNAGLGRAAADWIACVHQDVVFPPGWWPRCLDQMRRWERDTGGRRVAVAGPVGVRRSGAFRGSVEDPHGNCRWGPLPDTVVTLDEHLLVVRRASGLRFDPALPGFHCYGASLCLAARARGLAVIAVDAPVVHRSAGTIDARFHEAAGCLLQRWGKAFHDVIPTCAATIAAPSLSNAPRRLLVRSRRRLSIRFGRMMRRGEGTPAVGDPIGRAR